MNQTMWNDEQSMNIMKNISITNLDFNKNLSNLKPHNANPS